MVTQADDMTADMVIAELHSRNVPVVRFDSADFPNDLTMSAEIGDGYGLSGQLSTTTREADLSAVRSLYYRRPSGFAFPGLDGQDARFAILQARYGLGGVLVSLPDCLYVNHPHAIADAEFKPAQLSTAVALGFDVPPTLITNDPDKVRRFINDHRRVIYKPLRSVEYETNGTAVTIWTQEVSAEEIDNRIAGTMHLFQRMVPKKWDLRITVAGDALFAVRIDSPVLDWRRDYEQIEYRVVQVPDKLADKIHRFLGHFRLMSGCFDFAIDADDRPVFLECNPNGQWAWMQAPTELPMASAFADLLEKGRS
ncbi:ATP-grasp ribosomal peptide maturase [Actinomadura meridiana]|uniref:ATP-grasp ribosomal peptide maturase n=1 Tax=Actinomadura meridiana TaxID=559626 RepID=A0ABP8C1M4_9ACTN